MIDLNLDEYDDGAVSQSGWVFADLLIALSVIFLATISFVPAVTSSENELNLETPITSQVRSQGFSKIYDRVDVEQLTKDLAVFRETKAIPQSVPLMHLQFVGAEENDEAGSGVLLALQFSIAMKETQAWKELGVTTSLSTSEKLDQGEILVRAVFGSAD